MSSLTVIDQSPQGRYKKYSDCLGSGTFKKVYRGFDTQNGRDVAWNEIYVSGLPDKEKHRFSSEVELLRFLENEHFIKYYSSWYDQPNDRIILITQIVTSGTLNNYVKGKQLSMEVIKRWSIQILEGLNYLHTRDPPIIHRDLKCSNIFIDGKTSTILIGDLGLSKRRESTQMSIAGTPEFMAPEIFADGVYDEKVDIYAFGMCVLELITKKVPYSECNSIRDIYNKVTGGELPDCLEDVKDEEAKCFIKKLISKAPTRPSAGTLLQDPFLTSFRPSDKEFIEVDSRIIEQERLEKLKTMEMFQSINVTEEPEHIEIADAAQPSAGAFLNWNTAAAMISASTATEKVPVTAESALIVEPASSSTISAPQMAANPAPAVKILEINTEKEKKESGNVPHIPAILTKDLVAEENVISTPSTPVNLPSIQKACSATFCELADKFANLKVDADEESYPIITLPTPLRETHAIITHHRATSSLNHRGNPGFGSGNMSPANICDHMQSPSRLITHTHTASLDNVGMTPSFQASVACDNEVSELSRSNGSTISKFSPSISDPSTCAQLRIVFDSDVEVSSPTVESEIDESNTNNEKTKDDGYREVVDNLTIGLAKQDGCEFTFKIVCYFHKSDDPSTQSTWTQVVRYTYGVSHPENLASDLVSNGIVKEFVVDPIADVFEQWLNQYLCAEMGILTHNQENTDRVSEKNM